MVEILIAAVIGGLAGAFGTAAWLRRKGAIGRARERRSGGTAAALQRSILDSLQDGVVVYDEDDKIVFFNPAASEILGVSEDSLATGVRTWEPLDAEGRVLDDKERPVAITARTGEPCVGVDIGLRTATGDLRWTTVSTRALHGEPAGNGCYAVVAAFTDITERREAQRALERTNAELAQFAYVASHDLSEPLRMVSSYVQLLARRYQGQLDSDADDFIGYAVDGVNRMQRLIDDLLAYSRAGTSEYRFGPVDVGELVRDTLVGMQATVTDSGATVEVGDLPEVWGDEGQLRQLFQNLIGNGIKFRRPEEPPRVEVTAERHGRTWRFRVSDNGIGIDPRHAERIFSVFKRLHGRDEYPGSGIGLSICKRIVERHHGRIAVEASPSGGSTFAFTIPDREERREEGPGAGA
jgi:PAS domain S-box-containing protein